MGNFLTTTTTGSPFSYFEGRRQQAGGERKKGWGAGELRSWGAGELRSWGAGELRSWGAGELRSWGAEELRKKRKLIIFGYLAQEIPPQISPHPEAGGSPNENIFTTIHYA
ncbi:MAG: hypothetical protein F6K21_32915 [Symploca sp. SIO2D2]|nr:hypothetical protein [Symploca sp. SIO2D2]